MCQRISELHRFRDINLLTSHQSIMSLVMQLLPCVMFDKDIDQPQRKDNGFVDGIIMYCTLPSTYSCHITSRMYMYICSHIFLHLKLWLQKCC